MSVGCRSAQVLVFTESTSPKDVCFDALGLLFIFHLHEATFRGDWLGLRLRGGWWPLLRVGKGGPWDAKSIDVTYIMLPAHPQVV